MIKFDKKFLDPIILLSAIFFLLLVVNQLLLHFNLEINLDILSLKAHLNALAKDLGQPAIIILVLLSLPISLKIKRFTLIFLLLILSILPIADYIHFRYTLSRFHWNATHDLNFYSLKTTINLKTFLMFLAALGTTSFILKKSTDKTEKQTAETLEFSKRIYKLILFFAVVVILFLPFETLPDKYNFSPVTMPIRGKNAILKILKTGVLNGFLYSRIEDLSKLSEKVNFNKQESLFLQNHGLIPKQSVNKIKHDFTRIIFIVFEGLALDYLHTYNSDIPPEATSFFDYLIKNHTSHADFYTSDSPTINGLNAMLMSKIPYKPKSAILRNEKSLAKLLKDQKGFTSIFIRGVSKFYSNEHLIIRNLFGFDHLIAYEDLAKLYPKPDFFDWGYHDDVVFAEGLRLLKEQRKEKTFMVIKLIDQHQPPHYCGIPDEELPEIVRKHPSKIIKMLYWANHCLENFYRNLKKDNLLDNKTLLIITSDHYAFPGFGHQKVIKEKFDPLGRLPLIFVSPGNKLPLQTEKTFSQLDLTPAICDILGIAPSHYFIGQSMFSENSVSRRLGIFEDKIILKNKDLKLELDCANKIFPNSACEKWFINLFADH